MSRFNLTTNLELKGDQPEAVEKIVAGLKKAYKYQTLLGITGSGKTFTMANVIGRIQKPTLIISHNKTLAAQLYSEFKDLFPENAVEYFVSYYDYYQPEAYLPVKDLYIEKEAHINEEIEKLRNSTTSSLLSRKDVIVVSSVSCIYGLGSPQDYREMVLTIIIGQEIKRRTIQKGLVDLQYSRNDLDPKRGSFRVRGDVVEVFPSYSDSIIKIEMFGDEIEKIREVNPVSGKILQEMDSYTIFPAKHFVMPQEKLEMAFQGIEEELEERLETLNSQNKLVEAQRLEQRTRYDLEMMREMGYCSGIENYSRHLTGLPAGTPPYTLLDFFPEDYLVIIDESHRTVPQIGGMYEGDRTRKQTLVNFGFRLPSAMDNRPLKFLEFQERIHQVLYVSATPADFEIERSSQVIEQIIRPTGLLDPEIIVKPTRGQVDDLFGLINGRVKNNERVLVTTLSKRMSESLTEYLVEGGIRARYLHSEIETLERVEIIRDLRLGDFDVLVGINLLREGLDIPEVSLVAILDADKQGFLRSETSLIQTIGRAARNANGQVIMYGDRMTRAMKNSIDITNKRRKIQEEYNSRHGITPLTISKKIHRPIGITKKPGEIYVQDLRDIPREMVSGLLTDMEIEMKKAAGNLEFERAAVLRDKIREIKIKYPE